MSTERHALVARVTLIAACVLSVLSPTSADQPRTRTLEFDRQRKEWAEQAPPLPGTAAGDLHLIRVQIRDGQFGKALSASNKYTERHGESGPLFPKLLIAKSEALIGQAEYDKAHTILQEVLATYTGTDVTPDALRLEFIIAEAYLGGAKRKVWGVRLLSGVDLAYQILDRISVDYPDTQLAELAVKTKSDHLFDSGEHSVAELEYSRLLRDYPRSRYHQFALRRAAEAAVASFSGVDYDAAALLEAQARYEEYRRRYPAAADHEGVGLVLGSIREMRAEKDFRVARYYERTGHLSSAVYYYRTVSTDWPDTIAARQAMARLSLLDVDGREAPTAED